MRTRAGKGGVGLVLESEGPAARERRVCFSNLVWRKGRRVWQKMRLSCATSAAEGERQWKSQNRAFDAMQPKVPK